MKISDLVLNYARKATGAFITTLAGALGLALLDGDLSRVEALASLGTALVTTATVYGFKNTPKV